MGHPTELAAALEPFVRDFEFYAPRCLYIKDKAGTIRRLRLNRAQRYAHQRIEEQKRLTGKVRALILKGRQQGLSTYIEARGYWRTSTVPGQKALILTHLQEATDNLFAMTERYHQNCPQFIKPRTKTDSAKALTFADMDSGFHVSTAGSKDTGRSSTYQFFHGSEAAFWKNAAEHMAGVGQTVPNEPGTEILLESTANGIGNDFHQRWQDAERGIGDYIAIFVPWFWDEGYTLPVPSDFMMTTEEADYQANYQLTAGQMAWRRKKITDDFRGNGSLFDQEYPATPSLAFQRVDGNPRIRPEWVEAARKRRGIEPLGAKILGVDVAEFGDDDTSLVLRQGRVVLQRERFHGKSPMEVVGLVSHRIENWGADLVNVDVTGVGSGVADRLLELGYEQTNRIHFGARAIEEERYMRRGDEMWGEMANWFRDEEPSIPDDDVFAADLVGRQYGFDSSQREILEGKQDMKKRGVKSPDDGDALGLTFAVKVAAGGQGKRLNHKRSRNWRH